MTRIFMDTEFTGLHKETTLISIGIVSDCGKEFYSEFTDYDRSQVDSWIQENVIDNLLFNEYDKFNQEMGAITFIKGDSTDIMFALKEWLNRFDKVELWSDCHHYDVVLLHDIFGGAFGMPEHVYYIPFDISTVFKIYGIDPDISREAFIDEPIKGQKHNALYDSKVIRACHDKLMRNKWKYLEKQL